MINNSSTSVVKGVLTPIISPQISDCLIFESSSNFSFKIINSYVNNMFNPWSGILEYSLDNGNTYTNYSIGKLINTTNNSLRLRGKNNKGLSLGGLTSQYTTIQITSSSNDISCSGDIQTLLDYPTVVNGDFPTGQNATFSGLFKNCTALIAPPTLSNFPSLYEYCFTDMFYGCTRLSKIPKLFVPILPTACYSGMFYNCSLIKISPMKSGIYQQAYEIGAQETGSNALKDMFYGTGGTFTGTPTINTTYYTSNEVV